LAVSENPVAFVVELHDFAVMISKITPLTYKAADVLFVDLVSPTTNILLFFHINAVTWLVVVITFPYCLFHFKTILRNLESKFSGFSDVKIVFVFILLILLVLVTWYSVSGIFHESGFVGRRRFDIRSNFFAILYAQQLVPCVVTTAYMLVLCVVAVFQHALRKST